MRATIRVRDRIGKGQNLIVIAVVVLKHDVDKHFIALSRDRDWLWMQDLFVLAELLYKFFDPVFVEKLFYLRGVGTFIRKRDFQTGIEKRQFAQPRCETLKFELRRDGENRWVRQKRDQCAGGLFVFDLADDSQFVRRLAP